LSEDNKIKVDYRLETDKLVNSPETSARLFERGDVSVLLYSPNETDTQTAHKRDEIYIVAVGHGTFRRGKELVRFSPGDMLFVAAHVPHRFESFSGGFKSWVVFFGPERAAPLE
jgi:mannose-6-phosphate isomerase-like protein (cupin superfamily)